MKCLEPTAHSGFISPLLRLADFPLQENPFRFSLDMLDLFNAIPHQLFLHRLGLIRLFLQHDF